MEKAGKYEILRKIGAGGFGVVYEGRDPFIKRRVAIKTCTTEDEDIRQRFYREVEIAGNLQHKNIVTIHDFGIEDGVPYLVQEYLTGEDLEHVIARGEPMALERKLDILLQAAHGMEHAHAAGVIHRDLKPGNIRLLAGGGVKVLDFGIAKLAHVESRLTKEGMAVGTAAYIPPEQIRGDKVDFRADIFSFGVLAYELLAMVRPFDGKTLSTLLFQILSQTPRPLAEALPGVPARLAAVVDRCLEKEVERRFSSFSEIARELHAILADFPSALAAEGGAASAAKTESWARTETIAREPVEAEASSESFGSPFRSRGRRTGFVAGVTAAVALLAVGAWLLRGRGGVASGEPASSPSAPHALPRSNPAGPDATASPADAGERSPSPADVSPAAAPVGAVERADRRGAVEPERPRTPPEPSRGAPATARAVEPFPAQMPPRGDRSGRSTREATPTTRAEPDPSSRGAADTATAPAPKPVDAPAPAATGSAGSRDAGAPLPAVEPAPAPAATAPAPARSPEEGVREALAAYVAAFNRLDKTAVRKIFPTVPDENFEGLADFKSYRMDLVVSKLEVQLPRVLVEARITHSWVTFSDRRDSSTRKEKMTFLQGPDGAWMRVQ